MLFFKSIKKSLLVISLAFIAVGYFLFIKREASLDYVLYIFCAGLFVAALISIIRYYTLKVSESFGRNDFLYGLIYATIAILVFIFRNSVKDLIAIILGILIILSAAIKIQDMIDAKKCGGNVSGLYITLMILVVASGVLVLIDPFDLDTFYSFTGITLMCCGISDAISNIYVAIKKSLFEKKRLKIEKEKIQEDLNIEKERKDEISSLKKENEGEETEGKFTRIDL